MSNCFDLDQDCRSVGPDLGPNCLQKLSADNKSTDSRLLHSKHYITGFGQTFYSAVPL